MEALSPHFQGNIAVVFSGEDPIATAKVFKDQRKENKKLETRAGFFEGDLLDGKGVEIVATLPSREELLATLLRTIQEGPRQVLGVIQGPPRDLLFLLNNYASKLQ
jgi:large subunit ribosomal protein L10